MLGLGEMTFGCKKCLILVRFLYGKSEYSFYTPTKSADIMLSHKYFVYRFVKHLVMIYYSCLVIQMSTWAGKSIFRNSRKSQYFSKIGWQGTQMNCLQIGTCSFCSNSQETLQTSLARSEAIFTWFLEVFTRILHLNGNFEKIENTQFSRY